ncbi:CHAT domain-containing protein [Nodularia sp. LEGE 04288]|uniref:CHAT domain-containing protein n=1 Tax=Nodularia sp. LEGE 04288 TaxID=1828639 RepID=UPI001D1135CF|nr:CHAT domain-containing protein [Nodularia sp. LEGE 04288]
MLGHNGKISNYAKILIKIFESENFHAFSRFTNVDSYLESRIQMYKFDRNRYSVYFGSIQKELSIIQPTDYKISDTTKVMSDRMISWSRFLQQSKSLETNRYLSNFIASTISKKNDRAVTFALFKSESRQYNLPANYLRAIRTRLNFEYINHYLNVTGGDIPTGVPLCEVYDALSRHFPHYDFKLLQRIVKSSFGELINSTIPVIEQFTKLLELRFTQEHIEFVSAIDNLFDLLENCQEQLYQARPKLRPENISAHRMQLISVISRHFEKKPNSQIRASSFLEAAETIYSKLPRIQKQLLLNKNLSRVYYISPPSSIRAEETDLGKQTTMPEQQKYQQKQVNILFLAANPKNSSLLRLDEEIRSVDQFLRASDFRDRFTLNQQWAVRMTDLQGYLLRYKPDIVHFSGHGSDSQGIILEDGFGNSHPVSGRALSSLFSVLKDNVRCVVMNACYSDKQAQEIAKYIDCVIGMSEAIGDKAAINFAAAFYQALGYGRDIKTAFDLGCIQIDIANLSQQDIPKLLSLKNTASEIVFTEGKIS